MDGPSIDRFSPAWPPRSAIAAQTIQAFTAAVRRDSPADSTASRHNPRAVQPATEGDGDVVLFDGRLDDRETLLASMPRGTALADAPDSTLVLAAWRQWGEEFLRRLQGEFALALFDARAGRLIIARDPVGAALYYWTNRLTFGLSDPRSRLSWPTPMSQRSRMKICSPTSSFSNGFPTKMAARHSSTVSAPCARDLH